MMKKYISLIICFTLALATLSAQVPKRPNPPRLVNDFAAIFSPEEKQQLERLLVEFNDSTSNQIVIVTVKDLGGLDKADFASKIGMSWGVGQKKLDNGLVILIKPKNETRGDVMISTGYGLEGSLPDAVCKRIVENEMIPFFRQNNYFGGVVQALKVIIPIAKGEYKYPMKKQKSKGNGFGGLVLLLLLLGAFLAISKKNSNNGNFSSHGDSGGSTFWLWMLLAGLSGRNHGGSWSDFSGGGRGGGNDDSFGGFGGGDFGGGGAGGSW